MLLIHAAGKKSAVHRENVSGYEACTFRSEKHGSSNELIKFAETLHGRSQQKFLSASGSVQQGGIEVSTKDAGSNGIYANSITGPFNCQGFGERGNGSFTG